MPWNNKTFYTKDHKIMIKNYIFFKGIAADPEKLKLARELEDFYRVMFSLEVRSINQSMFHFNQLIIHQCILINELLFNGF